MTPVEQQDVASAVVRDFSARGWTLATAESLTGGLLGATITAVPGASAVYRGGLITYATDVKGSVGQVPDAILRQHGAVSAETVRALASTTARVCGADVGVALSGVAGPDAQEGHPPGTVWLGWAIRDAGRITTDAALLSVDADADRAGIRAAAVALALEKLQEIAGTR